MANRSSSLRVLLCGGLGNQLFQYAFGHAIAERYGLQLALDIGTGFARDFAYQREYELGVFELSDRVELIRPSRLEMRMQRVKLALALRQWAFTGNYLIEPTDREYDPELVQVGQRRSYTVFGYWQDERYFADIEEVLRQELCFKRQLSAENQLLAKQMQAEDSVAVHVRRVQYDCALRAEYYDRAIPEMLEQVPNAKLYCFSDDPDWCRADLLPKYSMTVIDNSPLSAIEDFQLMTHCRHFITANSSFSWWGAWLGSYKEKYVILPKHHCGANQGSVPESSENL